MAKDSASRRAWVKNIAIIFLIILLLLTFFSETILTYSLPEVSAQYPQYAAITAAIKVSGTVKANESYQVIYEADQAEADAVQSRKVVSVYVKEGDTVEKDAPIMALKGGASETLEALRKEYDEAKKAYDKAVLVNNKSDISYEKTLWDAEKALEDAKNSLAKLNEEYELLKSGSDKEAIEKRIESLNDEITWATEQKTILEAKRDKAQAEIDAAQGTIDANPSTVGLTAAKRALDSAESAYNSLKDEVDNLTKVLEGVNAEYDKMQKANTLTNEIAELTKQAEDAISDAVSAFGIVLSDDAEKKDIEVKLNDAIKKLEQAIKDSTDQNQKKELNDQKENLETLLEKLKAAREKLDYIGEKEVDDVDLFKKDESRTDLQNELKWRTDDMTEAQTAYDEAKAQYDAVSARSEANETIGYNQIIVDTCQNDIDKYESQLKEKNKELTKLTTQSGTTRDIKTVLEDIKKAKDAVTDAELSLKQAKADVNESKTSTSLDLETQKKELDKLAEKLKAYSEAPENTLVTAPIAGRIVSVNYVAGQSVSSGATVASIEIADKGYSLEATLKSEEARKIQVGAECSLTNSWWYSNIEAKVAQIKVDPTSQGKNRIIVIEVKGDVSEGQTLSFSIGDKSQSYSNVLPNSAIREDKDGKFVLTVESKKTPLGVRYTAKRTPIEIVASDDTQSAVSGLYGSEFVITNSTDPISDRQQVRLADK